MSQIKLVVQRKQPPEPQQTDGAPNACDGLTVRAPEGMPWLGLHDFPGFFFQGFSRIFHVWVGTIPMEYEPKNPNKNRST